MFSPLSTPRRAARGTGMAHDTDLGEDESRDRDRAPGWSVMDVEDLSDLAKTMTIDDLTVVTARSRHEIQKKLIELGL
jgi:hypothetical protein